MPDDKTKTGTPDRIRINVHEPYELRQWANHFGVSQNTVIDAVKAVGPMAKNVADYLRRRTK